MTQQIPRDARWRKSTKSASGSDADCVEVAPLTSGDIAIRHSRHPDAEIIVYTPTEWAAFIAGAKSGEFDF